MHTYINADTLEEAAALHRDFGLNTGGTGISLVLQPYTSHHDYQETLFERQLKLDKEDESLPKTLPDYVVDEFYILHETIRHMITDLRTQPDISGPKAH